MLFGALEAGGTKMILSLGNENNQLLERESIPTRLPEETMRDMIAYFSARGISALGIGSFGPVELNRASPKYGYITTTPKLPWIDTPLLPAMRSALGVPVEIDTDVNAAALAEYELGAAKGLRSCLYVTVGTGIGGGLITEGNLVHGLMHPEMGHMPLRQEADDPAPEGFCPYHRGCLEGLACGPAIEKRWGESAKSLPAEHPAWDLEARYLAQMCASAVCMLSPQRIVLGGGVMHKSGLIERVREHTRLKLNGYIAREEITERIDSYIVSPGLGDSSGAMGALLLAKRALDGAKDAR